EVKDADGAGPGKAGANQGLCDLLALGSIWRGFGKMPGDPSKQRTRKGTGLHVYIGGISIGDAHLDSDLGDALVERAINPIDRRVDRQGDRAEQEKYRQACIDGWHRSYFSTSPSGACEL